MIDLIGIVVVFLKGVSATDSSVLSMNSDPHMSWDLSDSWSLPFQLLMDIFYHSGIFVSLFSIFSHSVFPFLANGILKTSFSLIFAICFF